MHLTFWQPIPSPHQRGLLEALASAPWVTSVRLRYEAPLSAERRSQGWSDTEFVGVDVARIATGEIPCSGTDQVNIFTGFLTHPDVWGAFKRIPSGSPGLCLAYAEAPDLRGFAGFGRKIKYRIVAWRLRKQLHAVLALGDLGMDFYRGILGKHMPVIAFGYYDRSERDRVVQSESEPHDAKSEPHDAKSETSTTVNLTCVGSQLASDRDRSESSDAPDTASNSDSSRSPAAPRKAEPSVLSAIEPTSPFQPVEINVRVAGLIVAHSNLNLQLSGFEFGPISPFSQVSVLPAQPSGLKSQAPSITSQEPQVSNSPSSPPRHVAPMLGKIGAVHSNTRRLLFVGQCIWRKGLDQLLVALASMPPSTPPWVLDVIGSGGEVAVFMQLAEKLDLVDRVHFRAVVKSPALEQFYLRADLVIVPSRWDGWGMAVNEALFAGVPVMATDRCGASSVIKDLPRCVVLPAKHTEEWPEYLAEWLEWGGAMSSDRARLQKAAESLTGEAGAELLRKTIEQASKRR
jgi:glycosyltransferase involved in cell wall biosynthesis